MLLANGMKVRVLALSKSGGTASMWFGECCIGIVVVIEHNGMYQVGPTCADNMGLKIEPQHDICDVFQLAADQIAKMCDPTFQSV